MIKGTHHKQSSKDKNRKSCLELYSSGKKKVWNKGSIGIMKAWNKNKKFPQFSKANHPNWRGNNATYTAKHIWLYDLLGQPDTCEHCGKSGLTGHQIHWANISRKYKRNKKDWIRLCAKCHYHYDRKKI